MSEPPREWRFYVEDMVRLCERVLAYTAGMNQAQFVASGLNYDATLRNLELIGEAATHVPDAVRDRHPAIPWRQISATRNRLIDGTAMWPPGLRASQRSEDGVEGLLVPPAPLPTRWDASWRIRKAHEDWGLQPAAK